MSGTFLARIRPPAHSVCELAEQLPPSPFNTPAYLAVRQALGETPCLLAVRGEGGELAGCFAYLVGRWFAPKLEIKTVPELPAPEPFWGGLRAFCRRRCIWELSVNSFAATGGVIPRLPGELRRRSRCEYLLDLTAADLFAKLSSNHRRSISRARRAGLTLVRTRDEAAVEKHGELMGASFARRRARGERVGRGGSSLSHELVRSTLGELFQAHGPEGALSSALVLRERGVAYYQSAGTSAEGMAQGASPWLICEIASRLREEGDRVLNLGAAASDNPGLQRFKLGFGARELPLEAAVFATAPAFARSLRSAAHTAVRAVIARGGSGPSSGSSTPPAESP